MGKQDATPPAYTGLRQLEASLPSHWYYDAAHYTRELKAVWYRSWVYLCRADTLAEPRAFRTFAIGDQTILLLRDEAGELRAFHNTCRHRGSALCTEAAGRLRGKSLVCPYHGWSYDLQGALTAVPAMRLPPGFDKADYSLYRVALTVWGGFVFVNLAGEEAVPLADLMRPNSDRLDNWPMEELVVGHRTQTVLACNWKVFWENFNECYHCPGVHPELVSLVPIYGRSIMGPYDDPEWESHRDEAHPRYRGGLRPGAESWSLDGKALAKTFDGLTEEERRAGHRFATLWPTCYVVGHVDYMRIVSMRPLGPERTELTAEWLFPQATLDDPAFDLANATGLAALVIEQDGRACEWNQQGLRSIAHKQGVLLPQEYAVHAFHNWVRRALGEA